MADTENHLTLMLALDPLHWRADDKAGWALSLVGAVDAAAPHLLRVESYEMRDTIIYVRMRTDQPRAKMRRLLRESDALRRLRARLADLGARSEFEFETE